MLAQEPPQHHAWRWSGQGEDDDHKGEREAGGAVLGGNERRCASIRSVCETRRARPCSPSQLGTGGPPRWQAASALALDHRTQASACGATGPQEEDSPSPPSDPGSPGRGYTGWGDRTKPTPSLLAQPCSMTLSNAKSASRLFGPTPCLMQQHLPAPGVNHSHHRQAHLCHLRPLQQAWSPLVCQPGPDTRISLPHTVDTQLAAFLQRGKNQGWLKPREAAQDVRQ